MVFMRLISHRGNITGPNPELENRPTYIDLAIDLGYDVEIDVRTKNDSLFLGHDFPQYQTSLEWLNKRKEHLWVHCKDFRSLSFLSKTRLNIFYHKIEDYTIISNGVIWAHNLENFNEDCIIPLITEQEALEYNNQPAYGICSDFIKLLDRQK